MLDCEERMERREMPDAAADTERLASGLDQLLESMAQADQPDSLDVEGILALMSISERCVEAHRDAARILEAQNEVLYAEEQATPNPTKTEERSSSENYSLNPIGSFLCRPPCIEPGNRLSLYSQCRTVPLRYNIETHL